MRIKEGTALDFFVELNYKDVYLVPQKSIVDSRKECDTSVKIGKKTFVSPVYPANMKSVVNEKTCLYLAKKGWFYTMHRFDVDVVKFSEMMLKENQFVSISTGVKEESYSYLKSLLEAKINPDYITLDVANAWSSKAEKMTKWIKDKFPETFLIVGNLATSEALEEITSWGADGAKAGISGGAVCITKNKTGFHRPMVSTLVDCCKNSKIPIIADGGIVEHGDISKACSLGATMVMAGSLFAGYDQSSGNIVEINDDCYKEYFGSASKFNKEEMEHIEGKKILVKYRGNMDRLLSEILEDLRSAVSYSGGKKLEDLKNAKKIIVK